MLKPKKKITKKEIKRDPLLETLYEIQQWVAERKKLLTQAGTGLIILILAILILSNQRAKTHAQTATQFGQAMVALQNDDRENAEYLLQLLVDEHGKTQDGIRAKYLLGKLYYDEGNTEKALPLVEAYLNSGENEIMLTNAAILAAHLHASKGQRDDAVRILKKVNRQVDQSTNRYRLTLELARLYSTSEKDKSKVEPLLNPLIESNDTPAVVKRQAEEMIGRAMS